MPAAKATNSRSRDASTGKRQFLPFRIALFALTSLLCAVVLFSTQLQSPAKASSVSPMDVSPARLAAVSPGTYEERNPNVVYTGKWARQIASAASRGAYQRSIQKGATASLTVVGAQSFSITTMTAKNRGIANILVDGALVGQFDGYGKLQYKVRTPTYALPDTNRHKITFQVSGAKNPSSTGIMVALDAFNVYVGNGPPAPPTPTSVPPPASAVLRRLNMPYFAGTGAVPYEQSAIVWLGQVSQGTSYADVRMAYNDAEIFVNVNVIDRRLWYNENTSAPSNLTAYDSASLYLNKGGNAGGAPGTGAYRFDAEMTWWESNRSKWQASYQGSGSSWNLSSLAFTTTAGWRGDQPNTNIDDRGWMVTYHIPFSSLGLAGPPAQGTLWGLGVRLHNRNSAAGNALADQIWPETMTPNAPSSWGQLRFGLLPAYAAPAANNQKTLTIKQGLNGQTVTDVNVGGYTLCAENLNPDGGGSGWWDVWGTQNWQGKEYLNVMNQGDPADWPCYNKVYQAFPLTGLPTGKVIVSAQLTLYQFGHAGDPGQTPVPSLIQLYSVDQGWNPNTINWNNAPPPRQNMSQAWAGMAGCPTFRNCPAVTWEVSQMVADAYKAGQPLRVLYYDADGGISSGKYFFASATGDWNAANRPTLKDTYGDP